MCAQSATTDERHHTLLIAPDSFKGTFTAGEVAAVIAGGAGHLIDAVQCPLADGGEGTLEVLLAALGGDLMQREVHDPLGRPILAEFAISGAGTAIVEVAGASGLGLLAPGERDAEAASSRGTGELVAAAAAAGASEILIAAGGSASTDGGLGAIEAIDAAGGLRGARLTVLADVNSAFERAAEVYGPQKGADPAAVTRLSARLNRLAESLPRDPRGMPLGGAAGGLSGGLWAAHGARLVRGAPWVMDAIGFQGLLERASAVVTGEGRLDAQTLEGKVVFEVALRGRLADVPVHVLAGSCALGAEELEPLRLSSVREAPTEDLLSAAGAEIARRLDEQPEIRAVEAAAVRGLRREVLRPGQSEEQLRYPGDDDAGSLHLVALWSGRIVATASVMREAMPAGGRPGDWRIRGMASLPGVRGQGTGARLLARCVAHARGQGGARIWCNARVGARSLYERAGMTVLGERFELADIGEHYLMAMDLGSGS